MPDAPDPLVPAEVDVRDLDGFMLNVERLLASELWALSNGMQLKAALSLWCRAWKQVPAASLPDDELVLAPFSGLSLATFRKERWIVMRGFVRCGDGRLYHRVLAADAIRAWSAKQRRYAERNAEAERLKRWRERRRNGDETRTNGVRQGQGQGQGQGSKRVKDIAPNGALSGKPDPDRPNGRDYRAEAIAVLNYLNEITNKAFRPVDATIKPIIARLREGYTAERLRTIAFTKNQQWGTDEKMAEYLRPATLYNATKCAQYDGELAK